MSSKQQTRAIVIIWSGKEAPDQTVEDIMSLLVASKAAIPELITAKQLNEADLARCLAGEASRNETHSILDNVDLDPIYHAIEFIGSKYAICNREANIFALRLSHDVSIEQYKCSTGKPYDVALLNAIEILATKTIDLNKYSVHMENCNITKAMLDVIYTAYNYHILRNVS